MQSINGMAEKLRTLIASREGLAVPGCYDVLSAMILEKAGFKAVFMSGYGVAASFLGNPDIGLTSLVETASVTRNVASALHIPLVVDADNGYGNEDNVVRTVNELERAGSAAMILEDQVFPKRCGHAGGKQVIPLDQYMRKLDCALRARQTPMCIVARTDAMSLDEGILRAKQFHAAGADLVLIDGLPSLDALKRVADEVPGRKVINLIFGGKTPLLKSRELHDLGFTIVLYSTPALYAAASALLQAMTLLSDTGDLNSISNQSVNFRDFQSFVEGGYLRRRGSEGLADTAAGISAAPVSAVDTKFAADESGGGARQAGLGLARQG
ncbi:MAG: isocitrate lyase/PEP mutase family protein [Polyangiaceae bacterium]|jgi:2-methylisocitrate lyase-like PEP mutase family enzyme